MIEITHFDDRRVLEFTSLKDRVLHQQNKVVCESEKLFLQLIHNKLPILKTLSTEEFAKKYNLVGDNNFWASQEVLEKIAGFKIHFDVLFLIDKPADFSLDDLDDRIILLNGVTSPENVGSIARSACAFNIKSIISDEKSCSPHLRRCIRVSMGNIFSMKTHHSKNIRSVLKELSSLGYTIISSANLLNSIELSSYDFPKKCVLIIGSEGHGIDKDILEMSDVVLRIKIDPQVAHLNAANAAAIFLSHMSRVI
jgi:tRNA G18 (ribose-2'-O)-methylase SpoU